MTPTRTYPSFGLYPTPAAAAEAAISYWAGAYEAAAEVANWWTQTWLRAPQAFSPWTAFRTAGTTVPVKAPTLETPVVPEVVTKAALDTVEVMEAAVAVETAAIEEAEEAVDAMLAEMKPAADDLTRLVGVGPKLAQSLAARGVTRFSQIAAWTKADLEETDKALKLLGRAERDAWIAQAKRFSAEA